MLNFIKQKCFVYLCAFLPDSFGNKITETVHCVIYTNSCSCLASRRRIQSTIHQC